jgi:cellulose synthase operon protein C
MPNGPELSRLAACLLLAGVLGATVAGCASGSRKAPPPAADEAPTLKSLATREVRVEPDQRVTANENQALEAYRRFLDTKPVDTQRSEALRRLGDLEMDSTANRIASGTAVGTAADYRAAVTRYQDYLKAFPKDPGNDRVLYQLASAHDQSGELELALKTLDRLVLEYPGTPYRDEANFRRGELLFAARDYAKAEVAFGGVLKGDSNNPYHERALFMQGWSLFKLARLEDALQSFFGVLDRKITLPERRGMLDEGLAEQPDLPRADRELIDDTFRVLSLCLQNLQGAESIPAYITTAQRRGYEYRVYDQLGELYIKQKRTKDAADTYGSFARRFPLHAQAPFMQARVIGIYQDAGFDSLALDAKKDYVSRYGSTSEFRRANPPGWERAQPLVKTHLAELARHYHAAAQKSKATADYQEAVRWYRAYLESFPRDPDSAQNNFLLAELLFEDSRFGEAAAEYEKTAYQYPRHAKDADAGYAALLAYAGIEKRAAAAELPALQRISVASALRFGDTFQADPRTAAVLTNAADKLYALRDGDQAARVAGRVLALEPPAAPALRRVAWTVVANTAFERNQFDKAERGYAEVLALTPEKEAGRNDLVERLAASVYKQGEQARAEGKTRDAVGHFSRIATLAPLSAVRATAQYDAAAALIGLKDWDGATRTLEDFRQRFPNHALQSEVGAKLAVAYVEKGQWAQAAGEFERVAANSKDPKLARDALWQSAELHDKAAEKSGQRAPAAKAYAQYLQKYPEPLAPAIEARYRLARMAKADANPKREFELMKDIFVTDQAGGAARTERTRYLGATAALALAAPVFEEYRKVALIEPLAKQLKLKKTKLEEVLRAYAVAADYGVADVSTAATYQTAALYQDFGRALLASQRPKKLSKAELEQYNVLLEEQAFPFEEKSTALHEVNAHRTAEGIYDPWVQKSFTALREMRPLRYGKTEHSEGVVDAIR